MSSAARLTAQIKVACFWWAAEVPLGPQPLVSSRPRAPSAGSQAPGFRLQALGFGLPGAAMNTRRLRHEQAPCGT